MKEREQVHVVLQNGDKHDHPDAEVTLDEDVLVIRGANGATARVNWAFVAFYITTPIGVKNLDEE